MMKKTIVIAPYEAQRILFKKYRKDNPFIDVKFMTREELVANCFYDYSLDATKHLIKNYGLNLAQAKSYLRNLVFFKDTNHKYNDLVKIKDELIKLGYFVKNDFIEYELSNSKIEVAYYSEKDPEINLCLKDYEYTYYNYPKAELPLVKKDDGEEIHAGTYYSFSRNDKALFYVFNEIEKLLKSGVPSNKIFLYGLSDDDKVIFDRLCKNYNLNVNGAYPKKIYDLLSVKTAINSFDGDFKKLLNNIDEEEEIKLQIIDALNDVYIDSLDLVSQKNLFIDYLSSKTLKGLIYDEAIRVLNEPIIDEDEYIYILNFAQGVFPSSIKDIDFLDDNEKVTFNIPTSSEYNISKMYYYKELIRQKGSINLIYSKKNFSSSFTPSPYENIIPLLPVYPIIDNVYSQKEADIQLANSFDLRRKYLFEDDFLRAYEAENEIDYMKYDPSFNGATHYENYELLKLSYSSIDKFYKCQYQFYLDNVLKIDDFESTFYTELGNFIHKILENIKKDSDFDDLWDKTLKSKTWSFTPEQNVFFPRIKDEIRKTFDFIIAREKQVTHPKILREIKRNIEINPKLILDGRLDKVIFSGDDPKYYSIIDYKSGTASFKEEDVKYGFSLQLPTYAYIASQLKEFEDKNILALGIQPLFAKDNNKIPFKDTNKYQSNLKLAGVYLKDKIALQSLDSTLLTGSKYLKSCSILKDGSFGAKAKVFNEEWFAKIAIDAKSKYEDAQKAILKNEFTINPKIYKGENVSCRNCSYRDICFKNLKNHVVLSSGEEEEE